MSVNRISVDRAALPALMLDSIKEHCRVRHVRDDGLLTTYIAAAIGLVERKCNVSLNPATYVVSPDSLRCVGSLPISGTWRQAWQLPPNNVREVVVTDAAAADISDGFELWAPDPGGSSSSYLAAVDGAAMPADAMLTLEVGAEDPADLAPEFFSLIARLTGSQYENREASLGLMGDGFDEELIALWRAGV